MVPASKINQNSVKWVKAYRNKAQCKHEAGKREYYLPCEQQLGGHCAAFFEEDLEALPVTRAVRNHIQRCPKGRTASVLGLVGGVVLLTGISFGQLDFCSQCGSCLPALPSLPSLPC